MSLDWHLRLISELAPTGLGELLPCQQEEDGTVGILANEANHWLFFSCTSGISEIPLRYLGLSTQSNS